MKRLRFAGLLLGTILLVTVPLYKINQPSNETVQAAPIAPEDDYPAVWKDLQRDALKDSWDMWNRECTSWVAWKAFQVLGYQVEKSWGDARDWPAGAKLRGTLVNSIPTVHSAAIDTSFKPGHVMWVEKINPNKTIHVSQYNANGRGNYSEADISIKGLVFIHFTNFR